MKRFAKRFLIWHIGIFVLHLTALMAKEHSDGWLKWLWVGIWVPTLIFTMVRAAIYPMAAWAFTNEKIANFFRFSPPKSVFGEFIKLSSPFFLFVLMLAAIGFMFYYMFHVTDDWVARILGREI